MDIRKAYTTADGRLISMSMEIANRSVAAGGGYVGLDSPAPTADKTAADKIIAAKTDKTATDKIIAAKIISTKIMADKNAAQGN